MITPGRADLAGLFTPPPADTPFRQGVIVAFDAASGANQVRVGGAVLVDLPILVSGDTVNYEAGDAVLLVRYQSSWALFGRVVRPGAQILTAAAVDFKTLNQYASNIGFSAVDTVLVAGTVTVPAWANQASVIVAGMAAGTNSTASSDILNAFVTVNGLQLSVPYFLAAPGDWVSLSPNYANTISVTPGSSITVQLHAQTTTGTWAVNVNNRASLAGNFIFRKV